jgi:hypothetical protein
MALRDRHLAVAAGERLGGVDHADVASESEHAHKVTTSIHV